MDSHLHASLALCEPQSIRAREKRTKNRLVEAKALPYQGEWMPRFLELLETHSGVVVRAWQELREEMPKTGPSYSKIFKYRSRCEQFSSQWADIVRQTKETDQAQKLDAANAASQFAGLVERRSPEEKAPVGQDIRVAAGAFRAALRADLITYMVHYAHLYHRVQREDAATIQTIRGFYRSPNAESPPPAVQAYLSRMERFFAVRRESVECSLMGALDRLDMAAEPTKWNELDRSTWNVCGRQAVKLFAAAMSEFKERVERLQEALAMDRVTLEHRQAFDSIVILFPRRKGEIQPWIEGREIRRQISNAISGLTAELDAYTEAFLPNPLASILGARGVWTARGTGACSECGMLATVGGRHGQCLECVYDLLIEADHSCAVCGGGSTGAWPKSSMPDGALWAASEATTTLIPCCAECMGAVLLAEVEAGRRPVVDVEVGSVRVDGATPMFWRGDTMTVRCVLESVTGDGLLMARPKEAQAERATCIDPPKIRIVVGLEEELVREDEGVPA